MKTHLDINHRNFEFARMIATRIQNDRNNNIINSAIETCQRWLSRGDNKAVKEWLDILYSGKEKVVEALLDKSDKGNRLRQSLPFFNVVTHRERWEIIKKYHETA